MKKDLKDLARKAKRLGWVVEQSGGNHLRWVPPTGPFIVTASTPSSPDDVYRLRKALKGM